jgi:hypothetical protein
MRSVFFVNENLGFGGGDLLLQYNGSSWSEFVVQPPIVDENYNSIRDVVATSATDIWIIRRRSQYSSPYVTYYNLYHFNGTSWSEVEIEDVPYDLEIDVAGTVYLTTTSSDVFYVNEGNGFRKITNDNIRQYSRLLSPSDGMCYIYSDLDAGIQKYENTSITNINNDSWSGGNDNPIEMISTNEGWVADGEQLFYFRTGDKLLQEVQNPTGEYIESIFFIDAQNGWALTSSGSILRYVE